MSSMSLISRKTIHPMSEHFKVTHRNTSIQTYCGEVCPLFVCMYDQPLIEKLNSITEENQACKQDSPNNKPSLSDLSPVHISNHFVQLYAVTWHNRNITSFPAWTHRLPIVPQRHQKSTVDWASRQRRRSSSSTSSCHQLKEAHSFDYKMFILANMKWITWRSRHWQPGEHRRCKWSLKWG